MNEFEYYITKYFAEYLPNIKCFSYNTIRSYRDSFNQFLSFLYSETGNKIIKFDNINIEIIHDFINYLSNKKNLSNQTTNQRLASIKSFFRYVKTRELSQLQLCNNILNIEFKKTEEKEINYLTMDEINNILSIPNSNNKKELRDLAIMVLLYDSGARVQELCYLKVSDIKFENITSIHLCGKGKKHRIVPISSNTSNIIKIYIKNYNKQNDNILFLNNRDQKFTRVGIQYILNKYIDKLKEKNNNFNKKITNHTFRHSKAMHLLENGVNIVYIRDFLGHSSVTTTEIYAKCSLELKRKCIEKNENTINIESNYTSEDKTNLLDWLKSL